MHLSSLARPLEADPSAHLFVQAAQPATQDRRKVHGTLRLCPHLLRRSNWYVSSSPFLLLIVPKTDERLHLCYSRSFGHPKPRLPRLFGLHLDLESLVIKKKHKPTKQNTRPTLSCISRTAYLSSDPIHFLHFRFFFALSRPETRESCSVFPPFLSFRSLIAQALLDVRLGHPQWTLNLFSHFSLQRRLSQVLNPVATPSRSFFRFLSFPLPLSLSFHLPNISRCALPSIAPGVPSLSLADRLSCCAHLPRFQSTATPLL